MIGTFDLHGLWPFMLAFGVTLVSSVISSIFLFLHYEYLAEGETWLSASPRFRAFLSAGTLVILNIIAAGAWFVYGLPASEAFRRWFDSVVLYTWVPLSVLTFLLTYFGLKIMVPLMSASIVGQYTILVWASLSGTLSILVTVLICFSIMLMLFTS